MKLEDLNQKIEALDVGEILRLENVPEDVYHASVGFGSSKVKTFMSCPLSLKHELEHGFKDPTPAMVKGSAFHMAVLEPERFRKAYAIKPEGINKRTKAGKEEFAAFEESCKGKEIIDMKMADEVSAMLESCNEQFGHMLCDGNAEVSYWRKHESGLVLKARIDYERGDLAMDLKSTADPVNFLKACRNFRYDIQAVHYLYVSQLKEMIFLPTGSTAPFLSGSPVMISEDRLSQVAFTWGRAIDDLADSLTFDIWQGLPKDIQTLDIAPWEQI